MYNPDNEALFTELIADHHELGLAVEHAHGVTFNGDEERIVGHLFKPYAEKEGEME